MASEKLKEWSGGIVAVFYVPPWAVAKNIKQNKIYYQMSNTNPFLIKNGDTDSTAGII